MIYKTLTRQRYIKPLQDRHLHVEVKVGLFQRRMEIHSESLKEKYQNRLRSF